ncbi:MAG: TonB-dependent hemoglobin, partial [Gammaproteobacteria bacterium]|nr:TonB-dependent hemoglobin [Gammaproteobacteria bacterium]
IPFGPGATVFNRFVPNPNLKPQETETIEAGIGFSFNNLFTSEDSLETKGTLFRIEGKNFIDQVVNQTEGFFVTCFPFIPGDCDGTTTSVNVPNARLWESEVETTYENTFLMAGAGYSHIDGKDEDTGNHLGVLAPDQFTFHTEFKLHNINAVVG